jgi:hypothetical protein
MIEEFAEGPHPDRVQAGTMGDVRQSGAGASQSH